MDNDRAFCHSMLPKVSRTFALCIRLLPSDLEYPILVAYLLCRIADTIEDTPSIAPLDKRRLLERLSACLDDSHLDAGPLRETFAHPQSDEEQLAFEADATLREFRTLPTVQRECIRPWVQEMCSGMADFATMQSGDRPVLGLETVEDLERYCYYVAGTVGHLLTDLFQTDETGRTNGRHAQLDALATSFGLGLQITNIIKDVGDDRLRGWSFIPRELCRDAGVDPATLQDPVNRHKARNVMNQLIEKAQRHLDDALEYCVTLPRSQYRVRMFCLTSMYFAVRTLSLARTDERLLDPEHKVKISRKAVYRTVAGAALVAPSNFLVRRYFRVLGGR